ncbi:Uncharacterised protein [Salmonella enterica subsp. enterica serovar Bovismorbificans]|uniref:Uncharacterized protein n=1 Tax=Salmonella enterica subsp. enterica serovar Bovismorbificans TaxID=58097 RepID=A0A655BS20_SALET|nr:Uncharacterised protein [Salmonella enterica subsp. enterica serovar Bovismorbificans]CNT71406.1 Uncharacterised protein [Salmonella enterica subsp. enterica serovar Bovismorbificans]CNT96866.1 Uncharacterised protein [Salmonella enterica subsp. enterica serovar Bovismorbificans]CNU41642.1 Uncharacterised protein [Salmonella enterica subsp. enterica serovar Bovismorbificans]CPR43116.1 Uncharacterised protein [Salmonella enterica subsp. enterica serovar Bovismorbificans]
MRHRTAWADQHPAILIDDPELGAPTVRRHTGAGFIPVVVMLK